MNSLLEVNPVVSHMPTNTVGRDFVVGDIHGCIHMLEPLLIEVKFDYEKDRLFSVGDLVDRGLYSKLTLELLRQPWFHACLGNHEDLARDNMVSYLIERGEYIGEMVDMNRVEAQAVSHIHNGGKWLLDYFADRSGAYVEEKILWCKEMIERINQMPLVMSVGEGDTRFNVVHSEISLWADVATDKKLDEHPEQFIRDDFVWARNMFNYNKAAALKNPDNFQSAELSWTFSGHTPVPLVTKVARQINIDTCAFYADFISKERNGTYGLTLINAITFDCTWINGATQEIFNKNLSHLKHV